MNVRALRLVASKARPSALGQWRGVHVVAGGMWSGRSSRPLRTRAWAVEKSVLFRQPRLVALHCRTFAAAADGGSGGGKQGENSIIQQIAKEEAEYVPMTVTQKAKEGVKVGFWLGLAGLAMTASYFFFLRRMDI